jgi:hypothetical protein
VFQSSDSSSSDTDGDLESSAREDFEYERRNAIVTILAGVNKDSFKIHWAPLIKNSTFFWKAKWTEDDTLVKLPNVSTRYFKMYTHWTYTAQLDFASLGYRDNGGDFARYQDYYARGISKAAVLTTAENQLEKTGVWADHLVRFWVHAEFLGDVDLQHVVSEQLVKWWLSGDYVVRIHERTIAFVDKHTTPDHPLRQFCIDWAERSATFQDRLECLDSGKFTKEKSDLFRIAHVLEVYEREGCLALDRES